MEILAKTNKIQIICPICKTRDIVGIPPSRLNKRSQLTTISVHKGLICPHHFQFFIDRNFQIRGYQKVDLELNQANARKLRNGVKAFSLNEKNNTDLFEKLELDKDKIVYKSVNHDEIKKVTNLKPEIISKEKNMTSKQIYEEFWEFIDDSNEFFHDFIVNDNRRQKSSVISNNSECITL